MSTVNLKVENVKIWVNSGAITPENFMGSGWLLNVAKRLCQQTLSLSLIHQVWWWFIEKKSS